MSSKQVVTDDYERWYTEHVNNNRMVLALKSGIHQEVNWALDRLARLCDNEKFHLQDLPGLIEALFEWPEWYLREGHNAHDDVHGLFSSPPEDEKKTRQALLSILVLRSASLNSPNATSLAASSRTRPLILSALQLLNPSHDTQAEFLLLAIELYHAILVVHPGSGLSFPTGQSPLPILANIASVSGNRSLAIASLSTLAVMFTDPHNGSHLRSDSPALEAALRFLPAFTLEDKEMTEACVNYLYAHLSNSAMAKNFLLHRNLLSTLRLLVLLLLSDQEEQEATVEIEGPRPHSTPAEAKYRAVSKQELDELGALPEPTRCTEWMKQTFFERPDGQMSQVEFCNLYKETLTPYTSQNPLMDLQEVIKIISTVFPSSKAIILGEGPNRHYVVRGLDRRREDRHPCLWERGQCSATPSSTRNDLMEHVRKHIVERVENELPCLWASCSHPPIAKAALLPHVATHLQSVLPVETSVNTVILPPSTVNAVPSTTFLTITQVMNDPPATSLTALLCIRLLFHLSFSAAGEAPKLDADHFGFPGVIEEDEDGDIAAVTIMGEEEGERRGRQAFVGVRHLLENVRIKDDALMDWITEMIEAGTSTSLT